LLCLKLSIARNGSRVAIVNECNAVTYKDTVLYIDTFTDECVARNLAILSDRRVLLNFDESADFCVISDFTTVQINELRELDVRTQPDIRRNR
jgi:hypothetical protein